MGVLGRSRDPVSAEQTRRERSGLEADEEHRRVDHVSPRGSAPIVRSSGATADSQITGQLEEVVPGDPLYGGTLAFVSGKYSFLGAKSLVGEQTCALVRGKGGLRE